MSKEAFVKSFEKFLIENVPYFSDITALHYVQEDGEEYIYIDYKSHSQRRLNVGGDSEYGILCDFVNKVEQLDWVVPMRKFDK